MRKHPLFPIKIYIPGEEEEDTMRPSHTAGYHLCSSLAGGSWMSGFQPRAGSLPWEVVSINLTVWGWASVSTVGKCVATNGLVFLVFSLSDHKLGVEPYNRVSS